METNIKINRPHPARRHLKKPSTWLFYLGVLVVAVVEAIHGNPVCTIWALLAGSFHFMLGVSEGYADDFVDLCCELQRDKIKLMEDLDNKENEIAILKTEIVGLKYGKHSKE